MKSDTSYTALQQNMVLCKAHMCILHECVFADLLCLVTLPVVTPSPTTTLPITIATYVYREQLGHLELYTCTLHNYTEVEMLNKCLSVTTAVRFPT